MPSTLDEARVRFVEEMDIFLGGIRSAYDDSEAYHMIRQIDYLRLQILGIVPDVFTRGVIFGLLICQSGDLQHAYQGGMSTTFVQTDPTRWVITRGEIWDGSKIKQILPLDGYDHVYELSLPAALSSAPNSLSIGALFYMIDTGSFFVKMLGQTATDNPAMFIEKDEIDVSDFVDIMMGYGDVDSDLIVPSPTNGIRIAKLVVDVDDFDAGEYTVYARPDRDLYPFPEGMSFDETRLLSKNISDAMKIADLPSFDETLVSGVLLPIFRSPTWVPDFKTYWSGTRTMPTNVQFYYDILEDYI